jgi:uncharacterized protein YjbJ (UPF0337 family)
MSNAAENLKGRAKEAAGSVTGDDHMRREGKVDQASANIKDKLESVVDRVEEGVEKAKDGVEDKIHRK